MLAFYTEVARNQSAFFPEIVTQIKTIASGVLRTKSIRRVRLSKINFLVRKPRRNVEKVAGLAKWHQPLPFAPANLRPTAEDIDDRVLLSMVMYSDTGSRLDEEEASPDG